MTKQHFQNLCSAFRLALRNGLTRYEAFLWIRFWNPKDAEVLARVYGE